MLDKGHTIGDYEVISCIGKGGMSEGVYKVRHLTVGNYWAIKEIRLPEDEARQNMIIQEANMLRELNFSSIPRIVNIYLENGYIYIVQDYIRGDTLATIIKGNDNISESIIIEIAKQLCNTLAYLHNRPDSIIYRDMKPDNIILDVNGDVKLIDFGIAKKVINKEENDNVSYGTDGYAAPEQFPYDYDFNKCLYDKGKRRQQFTNKKSDIYSLGALLFDLATEKITDTKNEIILKKRREGMKRYWVNEVNPDIIKVNFGEKNISEGLVYVIKKSMEYEQEKRYNSAEELLEDLENIEYITKRMKKKSKSYLKKKLLIALALAIVVNGAFISFKKYTDFKERQYMQRIIAVGELVASGNHSEGIKEMEAIIAENPKDLRSYGALCYYYLEVGHYNRVIEEYESFEDTSEFHGELLNLIGLAYFESGDYEKSIELFEEAIEKDPSIEEIKVNKCAALIELGAFKDAKSEINKLRDKSSEKNYLQGLLEYKNNNYPKAIEYIEEALEDQSKNRKYYFLLSEVYRAQEDYIHEIEVLNKAKESSEGLTIDIDMLLGNAYQRLYMKSEDDKYIAEAIRIYEDILKGGFESEFLRMYLGRAYRLDKQYRWSEENFLRAIEIDSEYGSAYIQLGYLYIEEENSKNIKNKDYTRAEQYLVRGIPLLTNINEKAQAENTLKKISSKN